jgi:3-hydroxybutyryl-CoA dehydrogenase
MDDLAECPFVIETVKEDLGLKHEIYDALEQTVSDRTVIASNTSSFPVVLLQRNRRCPERFLVMHWAEPAWITRYLEIVPGERTAAWAKRLTQRLGVALGKEPTLLKMDIRGFISNRMMYAIMREACHLVELGVADVETVDRSFRNDVGCWAALAGPFRWMDLTGIPAYATVMEGVFPELSARRDVPEIMQAQVRRGAQGIANSRGFYRYTRRSAREWERAWIDFTHDIQKIVDKYRKRVKV